MKPFASLALTFAHLAPADAVRAGDSGAVAEIVTFRLADEVSDAAFVAAARATGPLVRAMPGFLSRRLTRGKDGSWTDHVEWSGLAEAGAAAARIMADPGAAPFISAIDPESIIMRHEAIVWTMTE